MGHIGPENVSSVFAAGGRTTVNPIGSGDAMAAGIAWAIRAGRPMVEAVRLGMAAAAENLAWLETWPARPGPRP